MAESSSSSDDETDTEGGHEGGPCNMGGEWGEQPTDAYGQMEFVGSARRTRARVSVV